jgi:hypothetical protein
MVAYALGVVAGVHGGAGVEALSAVQTKTMTTLSFAFPSQIA